MPETPHLWMRHETRASERRAPLVPEDAGRLVRQGVVITVEESGRRVFPLEEYAAAGCRTAPAGSWTDAPRDAYVLGLKELPAGPARLEHRHIFFGHAYKGQEGAGELLGRFAAGGGALLDLEYLVDEDGRRLAAFGYWAGYVGAALALLYRRGMLKPPLRPLAKEELDALLREGADQDCRALVIGALGRCGRGACDALAAGGVDATRWDVEETRDLDRRALLAHDLLVNTVLTTRPVPPFLRREDLDAPGRRLSLVSDVTCDVTSECNVLPVYDQVTDWDSPVRPLACDGPPAEIVAIDNLPSLLPAESSRAFSAELAPQLALLGGSGPAWRRALRSFETAVATTVADDHHERESHVR
ncbi:saccharopine dehydrogenase [Streptomyces sp. CO7]